MPGDVVAELRGAVKRFKRGPVIGPLNLAVEKGRLVALIGPNGAGKTTTIRVLLGVYRPDEGEALLCGDPAFEARGCAAYVPEETAVYPRLTGWEHLIFYASMYTGDPAEAEKLARRAAGYTGLSSSELGRRVGSYSKGMRRRLVLGLALALNTPLLVLDEPTSGLDVYSAVFMRRLIRAAASEQGRGVLLTSHTMLEVERLADLVVFIDRGKVIDQGPPRLLVEKYSANDLEEAFVKAVGSPG